MSKFKPGQIVKIIKRGQAPPLAGFDTSNLIGEMGIVKDFIPEEGYWVENIGVSKDYDWFDEDALEEVAPPNSLREENRDE